MEDLPTGLELEGRRTRDSTAIDVLVRDGRLLGDRAQRRVCDQRAVRLKPHREGGHFSEVFRSRRRVRIEGAGGTPVERSALTTIYFLLAEGEVSRWHRLDADVIWHFYEGEPLELYLLDPKAQILSRVRLGPAASGAAGAPGTPQLPAYVRVMPMGSWLAARPTHGPGSARGVPVTDRPPRAGRRGP
jgi:predicted cupin superfamily sugar epimerase